MKRRDFVKVSATAVAVAPFVAIGKIAELSKVRKEPLKPLSNGSIITSEYMSEIVNRINELEKRQ